jgi:hypothetical protein
MKVQVGDITILVEGEAELKAALRALGHAPSTNGKSHGETTAAAAKPDRPASSANPVDSGSLHALYLALPERQKVALAAMAQPGGATHLEICAALGIARNDLNGTLMTLSKKARAYKLTLDHVLSSSVTRDRQGGARVYTYVLTPEMRDVMAAAGALNP